VRILADSTKRTDLNVMCIIVRNVSRRALASVRIFGLNICCTEQGKPVEKQGRKASGLQENLRQRGRQEKGCFSSLFCNHAMAVAAGVSNLEAYSQCMHVAIEAAR